MRHRTDRWVKLAARGRFRMEAKARIGEKDYIEISAPKIKKRPPITTVQTPTTIRFIIKKSPLKYMHSRIFIVALS